MVEEEIESLEIRQLRHKLSSHGTEYLNKKTNLTEAYVPLRYEIRDTDVTAVNNTSSCRETINLKEAIETHLRLIIDVLDETIEKSINTFYQGQEDKKSKPLG